MISSLMIITYFQHIMEGFSRALQHNPVSNSQYIEVYIASYAPTKNSVLEGAD